MGQYHKFMNFDKKEVLDPPSVRKLTEWSYQGNEYMLQLEHLLKTSWKGDRVLVIGDYVDEVYENYEISDFLNEIRDENTEYNIENIYNYPYKEIKNTTFYSNRLPSRYIYNDLTKEYIDLKKQPIQWIVYNEDINLILGAKFHPLSLILSCSNGCGFGDYRGNDMNKVGRWAKSSKYILLSDNLLKGDYREFIVIFNELNKKDNIDILVDYISKNFKKSDIKKVKQLHFDPALFLDDKEKKDIIESSINNILKKDKNKIKEDIEIEMEER